MDQEFKERALLKAKEDLENRLEQINGAARLATWGAKELYKREVEVIERCDLANQTIYDPLIPGKQIPNIFEPSASALQEPGAEEYYQEEEPGQDISLAPGETQSTFPVADANGIIGKRLMGIGTILDQAAVPLSAAEITVRYNKFFAEDPLEKGNIVKYVRQFIRDGNVVSAQRKTSKGAVTYYQSSGVSIPIEKNLERRIRKGE